MKLYFKGHDCKYAAEQMLLTMYPHERPEYPEGKPEGDCAIISFSRGAKRSTAVCRLTVDGHIYRGMATATEETMSADALSEKRHTQRLVKLAFYRAALQQLGKKPAWGSITGIRPAKMVAEYLRAGMSPRAAMGTFVRKYDIDPAKARLCAHSAQAGLDVSAKLDRRDICLYIGIPFCPTRCAYCSFVSASVQKSMHLVEPFLEALFREIEATAKIVNDMGLRVISVYMGGGTPTTLSADQLRRLIAKLREEFDLSAVTEFCVEAGRPDTITEEKMVALRDSGVDRVSINPQTMNDTVLKNIGRSHNAGDIISAYETVRKVGGMAVNMDLIVGLPGDSADSYRDSLERLFALDPENITVHNLALKKGSAITLSGQKQMDGEDIGAMLAYTQDRMYEKGYIPYYLYRQKFTGGGYENVGWCKPGYENVYNVCIMEELCSIIALGGGASTKLVAPSGRIERIFCPKYPQEYIGGTDKVCADKMKIKEFYDEFCTE